MPNLSRFWRRLPWPWQRAEQELDEELRFHVEMEIEPNLRRGRELDFCFSCR